MLGLYHACISIAHSAFGCLSLWRIRNVESHPVFHQTYWELTVYGLFTKTKQNSRARPAIYNRKVIFRKEIIRLVSELTVPLKKILSEVRTAKSYKNAPIRFVISVRLYVRFVFVLFVDAYSVTFGNIR